MKKRALNLKHSSPPDKTALPLCAASDTAAETTSQRAARVATLEERHRSATTLLQRIESLVSEMRERADALRSQMESATAEIAQRQNENVQLAEQLVQFEAERNAGEAREGLLQLESEHVRTRLIEIDELLHTRASNSISRVTAGANFRRRRQTAIRSATSGGHLSQRSRHRAPGADGRGRHHYSTGYRR